MRKWLFIMIVVVLGSIVYRYVYKSHRNIEDEQPQFKVTSFVLIEDFKNDIVGSEKKYLNKTIEVIGTVSDMNKNYITLDETIICLFSKLNNTDIKNKKIKIKGRLIGYDDLLEQVKLDQCTINDRIE